MISYVLETKNLIMRPILKNDAALLWPYVSNPLISEDMSWLPHKNLKETQNFIDNVIQAMDEGKNITWCVFYKSSFCGVFSLISIIKKHRSLTYNKAELAYWLGPEFQGKGIMTEAGQKVISFAFKELGLYKLAVAHHAVNEKSRKLIMRLGFKFLYEEPNAFMKNGKWVNCKHYQLFVDN